MNGVSLKGRLLVALPTLLDPNFDRTVVLLLEHGDDGAVGVVLNRPSATELVDALPDWVLHAASPAVVFVGGPVQPEAAIGIATANGGSELSTVDLSRDPDDLDVDDVRIFAGYAGWGPGQLEGEIEEGAWLVVDALAGDVLGEDPEGLWARVLRRQGGRIAWLANYPPDPSFN